MKADLLLLVVLLATTANAQSDFRQLSARELREIELDLRHNPELLATVARTAETVTIELDSALTGAFVQEGVNVNIDCLSWLSNFSGGDITWFNSRFEVNQETGEVTDVEPQIEIQTTLGGRFIIGGDFDRWLNITSTNIIQGREDADHGNYTCWVCVGTPFEMANCHDATVTLYLLGAPPVINDTDSNLPDGIGPYGETIYRIGADFCIERGTDVTFRIECDILDRDLVNGVPAPIPTPVRTWVKDGIVVYNTTQGENPIEELKMDFILASQANMLLVPGVLGPLVFLPTVDGAITFLTRVHNSSNTGISEAMARDLLFQAYVGEWTCSASNAYGSDTATSNIRFCGDLPVIPDCPGMRSVIFPKRNQVVPVGCDTVCIREGTSVTLDCTVTAGTPPIEYMWFDGNDNLISTSPTLTVSNPDNYTCNAANLDVENREISLLALIPRQSYIGAIILGQLTNQAREDNGCGRLKLTAPLTADVCVFVGETLRLDCATEDGTALDIIDLSSNSQGGNFTITSTINNVGDVNGTFQCSLSNIEGPCGEGLLPFDVQVFDPARIDRVSDLGGSGFGVGRFNEVVQVEANSTVTLLCPTSGIPTPMDSWSRLVVNELGMVMEVVITGDEPRLSLQPDSPSDGTLLQLTIDTFFGSDEGTYVCRTSNVAGQDVDTINLTILDSPSTEMDLFPSAEYPYDPYEPKDPFDPYPFYYCELNEDEYGRPYYGPYDRYVSPLTSRTFSRILPRPFVTESPSIEMYLSSFMELTNSRKNNAIYFPTCVSSNECNRSPEQCTGDGTQYDSCGRRCTCENGQLIDCCRVRKEWRSMTQVERCRYVHAIHFVSTQNPWKKCYDVLIKSHRNIFRTGAHTEEFFLPFHRWYILALENLLRQVDCNITVPYWDWSLESQSWQNSTLWSAECGFGGDGNPSSSYEVDNGVFSRNNNWKITASNGTTHSLQRRFNGTLPDCATIALIQRIGIAEFTTWHNFVRNNLHDSIHCNIGGTMCTSSAASAPEFFLTQGFIDQIWASWQKKGYAFKNLPFFSKNTNSMPYTYGTSPADVYDFDNQPGCVKVCIEASSRPCRINTTYTPMCPLNMMQSDYSPIKLANVIPKPFPYVSEASYLLFTTPLELQRSADRFSALLNNPDELQSILQNSGFTIGVDYNYFFLPTHGEIRFDHTQC